MGNGCRQLDMAHALAANPRKGNLHTTFFADDAFVFHPLIFAAQAFIVLGRTEDARTEKPVTLRFERAVIDRLRFLDLAERPGKDFLRSGNRNPNGIEVLGIAPDY